MGLFGSILGLPLRIINAPIRAVENLMSVDEHTREEDRIFSKPLDALADELEEINETHKEN